MARERVALIVYVDLDPVPGVMHTADSAQQVISAYLINNINHYNPQVLVAPPTMQKPIGKNVTKA